MQINADFLFLATDPHRQTQTKINVTIFTLIIFPPGDPFDKLRVNRQAKNSHPAARDKNQSPSKVVDNTRH